MRYRKTRKGTRKIFKMGVSGQHNVRKTTHASCLRREWTSERQ
jgi:hypothetical protein